MNEDHVMVDLETADNCPTSAIVSIGAVVFKGPSRGVAFYTAVDLPSCISAGLTTSDDTMQWWSRQSEAARAVFNDPQRQYLPLALYNFSEYIRDFNDPRIWGNGASFDNAILANAYRAVGQDLPWKFWNDRCYRTAVAGVCVGRQQKGTHHNAFDDAVSQADHLMQYAPSAVV